MRRVDIVRSPTDRRRVAAPGGARVGSPASFPDVMTHPPRGRACALVSILFAVACFAAPPTSAQTPSPATRIPTVTRLVKVFSDLEAQLNAKLAARDTAAVERMLEADFEMRIASTPGAPIPRDAWVRQSLGTTGEASIDQMAVHDFGSVAVVSFRQTGSGVQAAPARAPIFVVDCWKPAEGGWKLATRYLSSATAPASLAPRPAKTLEKRY